MGSSQHRYNRVIEIIREVSGSPIFEINLVSARLANRVGRTDRLYHSSVNSLHFLPSSPRTSTRQGDKSSIPYDTATAVCYINHLECARLILVFDMQINGI